VGESLPKDNLFLFVLIAPPANPHFLMVLPNMLWYRFGEKKFSFEGFIL